MPDQSLWISMAQHELPEGPMHRLMKRANELTLCNEGTSARLPFATVDIGFSELLDTIRASKVQREIDLVYVTNLYHSAWTNLHISLATLGETLTSSQEDEVREVYAALGRLGMPHLLVEGLSKKYKKWLMPK